VRSQILLHSVLTWALQHAISDFMSVSMRAA
jgi:hypothetical protein